MKYPGNESIPKTLADADSDLARIALELRSLWQGLTRDCEHPEHSFDRQQFWVLGMLESGPQRMSSLAELSHTSQTSLTGIVDRLEDHGFVARTRSTEDRRVVEVSITELGVAELHDARVSFLERLDARLSPLDARARATLLETLTVLNAERQEHPGRE